MNPALDKQIRNLNLILMEQKGKRVKVHGFNEADDYIKTMIDYIILPNQEDETYSVKLIFKDETTLEYPRVNNIDINENFHPTVWFHEKDMKEPHFKIVFDYDK